MSTTTPAITFSCVHMPALALHTACEHIRDISLHPLSQGFCTGSSGRAESARPFTAVWPATKMPRNGDRPSRHRSLLPRHTRAGRTRKHERPRRPLRWSTRASKDCAGTRAGGIATTPEDRTVRLSKLEGLYAQPRRVSTTGSALPTVPPTLSSGYWDHGSRSMPSRIGITCPPTRLHAEAVTGSKSNRRYRQRRTCTPSHHQG